MNQRPVLALLALATLVLALLPGSSAAPAAVDLGTAAPFAVLAGAGITNTGATSIVGDVGSHPTLAQTGFGTVTLTGTNHGGDAVTEGAKSDLATAYASAAGRPADALVGALGGLTLVPGVYADDNAPDSMILTGTLTLDGQNLADPVFIFQSGSTLTLSPNAAVELINGAVACKVFWHVGTSATLDTGSHLEGTILAAASITLNHGATVEGRVLAGSGAVTMDNNTIQTEPCAPPPTTSSSSTSTTPSSTSTTQPPVTTTTQPPVTTTQPPVTTTTQPPVTTTTQPPVTTTTQPPVTTTTEPPVTTTQPPTSTEPPVVTTAPPSTPPPAIPVFPTPLAGALAAVGGLLGAFLVLRRRL